MPLETSTAYDSRTAEDSVSDSGRVSLMKGDEQAVQLALYKLDELELALQGTHDAELSSVRAAIKRLLPAGDQASEHDQGRQQASDAEIGTPNELTPSLQGTTAARTADLVHYTKFDVGVALLFILVEVPVLVGVLAFATGCLISAFEGWGLADGMLYVLTNVLGMGNPLTDVAPSTVGGSVVDLYVSLMALMLLGLFLNTVNMLPALCCAKATTTRLCKRMCASCTGGTTMLLLLVIVPLIVTLVTLMIAFVLAPLESWSVGNTFLYVISNLLGLANPLTANSPTTAAGKVVDCYVSVVALTVSGVVLSTVQDINHTLSFAHTVQIWYKTK